MFYHFLLPFALLFTPNPPSSLQVYALRLRPGQDLKVELQQFIDREKIEAACVLSCVGSLRKARIRYANQPEFVETEQKFEIVSLTGMLANTGSHLHLSLSDSTGHTLGGHIAEGNIIYTTAEIVIGIMPQYRFSRQHDPESGYKELHIKPKR
jgi:uncharacterized protein